ncbi:MAG: hypothetical protein AAFU65_17195 [Pseudomonadota bacterium]
MDFSCVFLSSDGVDLSHVDDHHAIAPLAELGVAVTTHSWSATDVDWSAYDAAIVRSTWDYHENVPAFFSALTDIDAATRLANPLSVMRWNSRKTYLETLSERGVPIVETRFGPSLDAAGFDALVQPFADREWVLKPDIGASSSNVFRLTGAPSVQTRAAILDTYADRGYLAQPFIPSVLDPGEYSVFFFDGALSHTILKTPVAGDFRVQEEYGGRIRAVAPDPALLTAAERVRNAIADDCLYVRVDLVRANPDRYEVMEVELIEPSLYLRTASAAPRAFARGLRRWLERGA